MSLIADLSLLAGALRLGAFPVKSLHRNPPAPES
jgi:hypothetical protein